MKIQIISDVHSNYEALLAVAEAEKHVDQIWCLGDLVDYGPQPADVVQWVRHHVRLCVRGNHDFALAFQEDCRCSQAFREMSVASRAMNRALLSPEQIAWLQLLPATKDVVLDHRRFRLAHGAPNGDPYRYDLTPSLADAALAEVVKEFTADVFLCGHTHLPMARKLGKRMFVNPGSVGQQHDGDPRASYAIWQDGAIKLHRVCYDVEATVRKLHASALPPAIAKQLAHVLRTGASPV
jgi:putative phosphoesterase